MTQKPEEPQSQAQTPQESPTAQSPSFGWNTYAERINGRFAMVGFISLLVLEWLTQQDLFTWIGLR